MLKGGITVIYENQFSWRCQLQTPFNDFQQIASSKDDDAGADVDEEQISSVKNDLPVSSNETAAAAAVDHDQ